MNGTLKTKQKEKISKYFYKTKMGGDSFMAWAGFKSIVGTAPSK